MKALRVGAPFEGMGDFAPGDEVLRRVLGIQIDQIAPADLADPAVRLTPAEIDAYVASGEWRDKAGAYAIQNASFHPVETMQGCYASVMGLPLCHLARSLHKLDIAPRTDIAAECQSALGYACPISSAVLRGEMVG